MSGRHSITKGKRVEREAVKACQEHFYAPEECRRSRQARGSTDPDLHEAVPGVHFEVKGYRRFAAFKHWRQAERDARDGDAPAVLLREDGMKDFLLLIRVKDVSALSRGILENYRKRGLAGSE